MPVAIRAEREVRMENNDIAAAMELLSIRNEDQRMKLEEMRLVDCLKAKQHQREKEARETEIRRLILEHEENKRVREQEERNQRREQEHAEEMKRLEMEENTNAREHELRMNLETQETIKLKVESDKKTEDLEKLKLQCLRLQCADNRHARKYMEKMAEQLESQRREEEQDILSLRNLGLAATGVGAVSGAISGALGTTAAVGLAAGVVGAATVLAPVTSAIAVLSGAGYVYKKVTSPNRA